MRRHSITLVRLCRGASGGGLGGWVFAVLVPPAFRNLRDQTAKWAKGSVLKGNDEDWTQQKVKRGATDRRKDRDRQTDGRTCGRRRSKLNSSPEEEENQDLKYWCREDTKTRLNVALSLRKRGFFSHHVIYAVRHVSQPSKSKAQIALLKGSSGTRLVPCFSSLPLLSERRYRCAGYLLTCIRVNLHGVESASYIRMKNLETKAEEDRRKEEKTRRIEEKEQRRKEENIE